MNCSACGKEIVENAKFCGVCGGSLSASTASSTGVESAEMPMTEDRRQLRPDDHFCSSCGEIIKKLAEICPKCGVRLMDAPNRERPSSRSSWPLAIPITSLVLGILGLLTFADDSGWDVETALGVLIFFGIPPIALGVLTLTNIHRGKIMGIIGLVFGCINTVGIIGIMATL